MYESYKMPWAYFIFTIKMCSCVHGWNSLRVDTFIDTIREECDVTK